MKPILFNTEMVRAILDGRKTVTRRAMKPQPVTDANGNPTFCYKGCSKDFVRVPVFGFDGALVCIPPYRHGDILYVLETFCPFDADHVVDGTKYAYKADATPESEQIRKEYGYKWNSSIHMPREAARIFLRVKNVRVERLQEITIDGIKAEGSTVRYTNPGGCRCSGREDGCMNEPCPNRDAYEWHTYADPYAELIWNKTIKPKDRDLYGWYADPWVWVIEFERISREEAILHDA